MASDVNTGEAGRPAVIYSGPPTAGGGSHRAPDRWAAEARRRAVLAGLAPLDPVARTVEEADAQLASHPDAEIVVHPGTAPVPSEPKPGAALWYLLHSGTVLRLCATGDRDGTGTVPEPPSRTRPAFLVVDQVRRSVPGLRRYPGDRRREADCRAYAEERGLSVQAVLTGRQASWRSAVALVQGHEPPLVLVHPEVPAPSPGTPDALLWGWLRQGRVLHTGLDNGHDEIESGETARYLILDERRHRDQGHRAPAPASLPPSPPSPAPASPPRRASLPRPASAPRSAPPAAAASAGPAAAAAGPFDPLRWQQSAVRRASKEATTNKLSGHVTGNVFQAGFIGSVNWYGGPQDPPHPRDPSEPLPHDGLFIRRNNAFGTRSALGVKDLIEQGVIVGQDQVRFDDFVVARTEQVPGPRPGEAVAVSHGLAAAPGAFKANEATTHFVEITLKAGDAPPPDAPATEPLAVNFVFVVDTSSSMAGEKLATVKSALHALYEELRPMDCLGVITFDHTVRTLLPAVAKKDLTTDRFAEAVAGMTASGATDINLGVQYGIDEISRQARSGRTVNCLYLFSDGDPTSGERDWITIRTNIAAKLRGDLTLSCFGFGSDARMPELAALAGLAGGHSTLVTRPEQVAADLHADLSRRDHLAAIDIQLRIEIDPEVEVRHLYGHDLVVDPRVRAAVLHDAALAAQRAREDYGTEALSDIITEEKGIRIFAPDLAFEETYWVVLEVRVPPGRDLSSLGTATVQYVDTAARDSRRHAIDLAGSPTLSEETVTVHAVGLWTSEVTFYALDDLYDHDKEAAKNRLEQHLRALDAAHRHLPADEFRDDQVTIRKFMTLAGTLGTTVAFSDVSTGGGFLHTVKTMNDFGRVRSGFAPRHSADMA
ncbi:VWA domain-containing protein [Streptomyces sp. TP-A0356]|uniref:VWA domain-containing protein n=1 Tax=Streptomyces sp. TP-A0356 TaxID=1359208 RepID=UPI0006E2C655|nr:VWA domain-containing protein [Streptomyces sp. TP-A0356]